MNKFAEEEIDGQKLCDDVDMELLAVFKIPKLFAKKIMKGIKKLRLQVI